ncbi:hypothetical protein CHISP_3337 [Chitinispirillum alkaliphilum]|nr:hypothetical protein CHISP_3337 [Chitinispirillum alkaliphilum]
MGLSRRSLPTFFGLGKKVGRGLGLKTPIVFETALLSAGLLKKVMKLKHSLMHI